DQAVLVHAALVVADHHVVGIHALHHAVALRQDGDARVGGGLVFHAGGHQRLLGDHQRHGLALHVGAHQGAVAVVVLQEGDHGGGHRDHHPGRNVHEIHLFGVDLQDVVPAAGGHAGPDEVEVLVQGLVGLGHHVFIFHVGGHIDHLVGDHLVDDAALFVVGLVDLAVGCLDEAVLVDPGIGCQVGDQADVGAFRGLDGAHEIGRASCR